MGHAAHFLRRLDRVSDAHVELALTLYRDDALLRAVLERAALPENAERLAISLADPAEGPFVIVTREGRFVTCLGEGMRVGDLPVVTHEQLEASAEHVQEMRERLAEVRRLVDSGAEGQAALAFRRMQQQGPRFAREDAETLLRVKPLIERDALGHLVVLHGSMEEHLTRIAQFRLDQPRKLSAAQKNYVLAFGDAVWSTAHLLPIVDSAETRRMLAAADAREPPGTPPNLYSIAYLTFDWGTLLHAVRALWFLSRGGKRALAAAKGFTTRANVVHALFRELALGALALRSSKLRAEAVKALSVQPPEETDDPWLDAMGKTAQLVAQFTRVAVEGEGVAERYIAMSRHFVASLLHGKREGLTEEELQQVPDEVARIAGVALPASMHDHTTFPLHATAAFSLPWLVHAAPEELFLPAEWAQRLIPARGLDEVLYWLPKYLEANDIGRRRVRTKRKKEAKVGRNAPCPCGSGAKYKRCCGSR